MKKSLLAAGLIAATTVACTSGPPARAQTQVSIAIRVNTAPPPLPVYVQPPLPGPDYLWTPGYWAWDDMAGDYFWVPGTWVLAPRPGLLWTPPWWGWENGVYLFHPGYWGPRVGFYGGVAYGFGYTGSGFVGGYWQGGHVAYNQVVNHITNVNVVNVYRQTVLENHIVNNISYNGGPGGVQARATPEQMHAQQEQVRIAETRRQQQVRQAAQVDRAAFVRNNNGQPRVLTAHPPEPAGQPGNHPATKAPPAMSPAPSSWRPVAQQPVAASGASSMSARPPGRVQPAGVRPGWPAPRPAAGHPDGQPIPHTQAQQPRVPAMQRPPSSASPDPASGCGAETRVPQPWTKARGTVSAGRTSRAMRLPVGAGMAPHLPPFGEI